MTGRCIGKANANTNQPVLLWVSDPPSSTHPELPRTTTGWSIASSPTCIFVSSSPRQPMKWRTSSASRLALDWAVTTLCSEPTTNQQIPLITQCLLVRQMTPSTSVPFSTSDVFPTDICSLVCTQAVAQSFCWLFQQAMPKASN